MSMNYIQSNEYVDLQEGAYIESYSELEALGNNLSEGTYLGETVVETVTFDTDKTGMLSGEFGLFQTAAKEVNSTKVETSLKTVAFVAAVRESRLSGAPLVFTESRRTVLLEKLNAEYRLLNFRSFVNRIGAANVSSEATTDLQYAKMLGDALKLEGNEAVFLVGNALYNGLASTFITGTAVTYLNALQSRYIVIRTKAINYNDYIVYNPMLISRTNAIGPHIPAGYEADIDSQRVWRYQFNVSDFKPYGDLKWSQVVYHGEFSAIAPIAQAISVVQPTGVTSPTFYNSDDD